MELTMENSLPILGVEDDCILSKAGDLTLAFEVFLPEIFTLGNQEYEDFHQAWVKALKILPVNSILHKQDWFAETKFKGDFSGELHFLKGSSERFFHERPYLDHCSYLFLTRKSSGGKPSNSLFSGLLKKSVLPPGCFAETAIQSFYDAAGQFEKILSESGFIRFRRIPGSELVSSEYTAGLIENYCQLQFPRQQWPVLKDIQFKKGFKIGADHTQIFTLSAVSDLPAYCGSRISYDPYSTDQTGFPVGFGAHLGQLLCCNHLFNQFIFIQDGRQLTRRFERKRKRLQSLAGYSRENGLARDAVNDFLNEAIREQRTLVKAHFNVQVWTQQKEQLPEIRNLVSAALSRMEVTPRLETLGAPQIWWAGIPGNAGDFPLNDTFDTFTDQAVCFLNLETSYRSSSGPCGLRLGDRLTGKPLQVDISDEPLRNGICTNRNKFILGPSGSGKSFFTNHLVRSYYDQGAHIVLVDVGNSYQGLCTLLKGYYYSYAETDPICFNPFYLEGRGTPDTEKKESIKTLLHALWKKDTETFQRSEYVSLSNALQLYYQKLYEHPEIFPCFNSFYEFLQQDFVPALQAEGVKEKDFDMGNLLYVLRPYYRGGEFDYLLNAKENLDLLQQRLIVFELDRIKDHPILFPVVTIIIMEVFIAKMRKLKGIRKMILIEEAWKAIAREGMAEYIKYLFKTVRKYFGEAVVVTQDVEDIISSPVVRQTIIHNSDCKILLDQRKYLNKFDQIQELLGLSEKEKTLVLSLNKANDPGKKYKEVFISLGGILSKVYRTEVSPEEYLTYTTEETEKVRVQAYTRKYGNMEKGIRALVQEKEL